MDSPNTPFNNSDPDYEAFLRAMASDMEHYQALLHEMGLMQGSDQQAYPDEDVDDDYDYDYDDYDDEPLPPRRAAQSSVERQAPRRLKPTAIAIIGAVAVGGTAFFLMNDREPPNIDAALTLSAPPELIDEFTANLAGSACGPDTARFAAAVYYHIYGFDIEALNDDQFDAAAQSAIAQLAVSRKGTSFLTPPDNYKELREDVLSDEPKLSVDTYETAVNTMLRPINAEARLNWTDSDAPSATQVITVDSDNEPDQAQVIRSLLGTIESLSTTPLPTLQTTGLHTIFYGDVLSEASGYIVSGEDYIVLDAKDRSGSDLEYDEATYKISTAATSLGHEVSHLAQQSRDNSCLTTLDSAWTHANPPTFTYTGEEWRVLLGADALPDGSTTLHNVLRLDLEGDRYRIVGVDPYSLSSLSESHASLIGAYVFDPRLTDLLFTDIEHSEPINRQLATYLGDLMIASPDEARYFTTLLRAARLEQAAGQRAAAGRLEVDRLREAAWYEGRQFEDVEQDPTIRRAQVLLDHYDDLVVELHNAQIGPLAPS